MIKSKFLNDFSNVAQGAFSTVNAIREELVTSLRATIGEERNLFEEMSSA